MPQSGQRRNPRWGETCKVEMKSGRMLTHCSVIAACIPSLRPLAAMIWRGTHRAQTTVSKSSKAAQATSSSASSRMIWPVRGNQDEANPVGGFTRLEDPISVADKDRWRRDIKVHTGKNRGTAATDEINLEEIDRSRKGIRVQNEITITSEAWDYKDRLY